MYSRAPSWPASKVPDLLLLQDGVVARTQALAAGLGDSDIRRLVRRREWAVVHPGVYVNHTGHLSWQQRAWAAVLVLWPAALTHESVLVAQGVRRSGGPREPIHVAIDRRRSVRPPAGVVAHRVADLDRRTWWGQRPPQAWMEEALLDLAAAAGDDFAAIQVLADGLQANRATSERLRNTAAQRGRLRRRKLIVSALLDYELGACSTLEQAYLTRVERAHGLPGADRQVRASSRGTIFRDVEYKPWALVVELDGRLFHDTAGARDNDLERDLDGALEGLFTIRLGWGQAVGRPCSTAAKLGALLQARGWSGTVQRCPDCS